MEVLSLRSLPKAAKSRLKAARSVFRHTIVARVRGAANRWRGRQVLHVLHIGKTGGTAIKEALRPCLRTDRFLIELHRHQFKLRDVPRGEKVIFFVRDPISRFMSGFYSRQRRGQPRYDREWDPHEEAAFRLFSTPNELAAALSSGVKEWQTAAVKAMRGISHVNTCYWDWFDDRTYFLSRWSDIFFIGFQESLNDDFAALKEILKLPPSATLPADDVAAHRNPRNLDTGLNEEAIRNLKQWYAGDYEFIELCLRWRAETRTAFHKLHPHPATQ